MSMVSSTSVSVPVPDIVSIQCSTPSRLMLQSWKYREPLIRIILSSPNSTTYLLPTSLHEIIADYATPISTDVDQRYCWPLNVIRDPDPVTCHIPHNLHSHTCSCSELPYSERGSCDHPGWDRHRHPCWRLNNHPSNNNELYYAKNIKIAPCICPITARRQLEIPKCNTCQKKMELLYELPFSSLPLFISESFWNIPSSSSSSSCNTSSSSSSSLLVWVCVSNHTRKKRRFNDFSENSDIGLEIQDFGTNGQKHRTMNYSRFMCTLLDTQMTQKIKGEKKKEERDNHNATHINTNNMLKQQLNNTPAAPASATRKATATPVTSTISSTETSTSTPADGSNRTTNMSDSASTSSCPCWCMICSASCHQRIVVDEPQADIPQVQYNIDVPQLRMNNQLFREWYRDNCSDAEGQRKFMPIKGDKLGGFPWFWHCQSGRKCAMDAGCPGPATFIMQVAGDSPLLEPLSDLFRRMDRQIPYGGYLYRCDKHPQHFTFEVHWSSLSSDDPFCNCKACEWINHNL